MTAAEIENALPAWIPGAFATALPSATDGGGGGGGGVVSVYEYFPESGARSIEVAWFPASCELTTLKSNPLVLPSSLLLTTNSATPER